MPIHCICPNGHRLSIHTRFAGSITVCGKCGERIQVPRTEGGLSDTAILGLLGDFQPEDAPSARPQREAALPERECPRCRHPVPVVLRTCPKCNVYMPPMTNGMAAG